MATENPPTNTASNEAGTKRKRRKKKKSQKSKRNNKRNNQPQSKPQHAVHLPHAKVTLRNIQDVEKFGNVEQMVQLLRDLIRDRNDMKNKSDGNDASALIAKVVSPVDIVLEEGSIARILTRDQRKKELKKQVKPETKADEESGDAIENSGVLGGCKEDGDVAEEGVEISSADIGDDNEGKPMDVVLPSRKASGFTEMNKDEDNIISARVLYMIPPHKSRRRGEIPGHLYLALYPPMPHFIQEKMKLMLEEQKAIEKAEELKIKKTSEDKAVVDEGHVDEPETNAEASKEGEVKQEKSCPEDDSTSIDPVIPKTTITAADRSKALAQCRLLLSETVASLSNLCKDDSKKDQNYRGVQILMSPSQKIWKPEEKGSRKFGMAAKYDSTIESNDDFKKFVESTKKAAEDLLNRPKPPPGGGQLGDATNTGETAGSGEHLSAIVLHLLEKKASSRRAKKKAVAEKKKSKAKTEKSKKPSGKVEGDKNRKKSKRSKKKNSKSSGDSSAKPKMLLKKA